MADILPAHWSIVAEQRPAQRKPRWRDQATTWTAAGSLGFHLAIVVLLALLPVAAPLMLPKEEAVTVEVLSAEQLAAMSKPPVEEEQAKPAAEEPKPPVASPPIRPAQPAPQAGAMIRADNLLSARTLADPRSKRAREAFQQLAGGERIMQLCNLEALEQVHQWKREFQPDYLMAYAMAGAKLSEHSVEADGTAFRSKQHWYNIKFKCEVTPDLKTVAAFEFLVGDEIPRSLWASHDLLLDDGPPD
jgi:type IV secretory pathway VirB10-like protein